MSSKSTRLLAIYKELRKGSLNIEKLRSLSKHKGWNISERTLYRYMDELFCDFQFQGENISIIQLEKNKKEWKIEFDNSKKENQSEDDLISYFLFKNYIPNSIRKNRDIFFDKLNGWVWEKLSTANTHYVVNNTPDCFINTNFAETAYSESEKLHLKKLIGAIQTQNCVEIKYQYDFTSLAGNQASLITVIPLKIVLHRGTLHFGFCDLTGKTVNLLALDQVISVTQKQRFLKKTIPINLQQHIDNFFGITNNIDENTYKIKLEISAMLSKFLTRREWHPTQKFEELEGGNYLMSMHCGISRELVGWIFSWMTNVKVLEPEKLKNLILEKSNEITEIYQKNAKLTTNNTFKTV